MARNNPFSRQAQSSQLSRLIDPVIENAPSILNALDFIEAATGLNIILYPMQRLIVRAIFGVPFDYKPEIPELGFFPIWDQFRETLLWEFDTEKEALHWLYEEGKCNIADWRDIPEGGLKEATIFAGRRGGKSEMVGAIASYALYKLLNVRSPQEYYKLIPGSPIDLTAFAQDDSGANRLYTKIQEDVNRAAFFNPYIRKNGTDEMAFVSESDRHKRDITPSIRVASFPCTTNSARGPSSIFLALDEFAHFRSEKGSTSEDVYAAAKPATMQFVPVSGSNTGKREALVLSISSPWKRVGKMYELHTLAMDKGPASGIFTLRVSTAEMNPRADAQHLRQEYETNQMTWRAEYGGMFLESSETFVKIDQVKHCVDVQYDEKGHVIPSSARKNCVHFTPKAVGRQYFWGLDLGMQHDATALAIGHLEFVGGKGIELIYDYVDRMMVGELFEGPGVPNLLGEQKYVDYKALVLEDVLSWLTAMHKMLPCFKGLTDQHGGQMLVRLLQINGISNMDLVHLNPQVNSRMFFALKGYIDNNRCRFPYEPKFINEINNVEAELVTKYVLKVQAPLEKGAHDDMVDAVSLVALMVTDYLETSGHLLLDPTGQSFAAQERLGQAPAPIANIDGVSLQDLRILDQMSRMRRSTLGSGPVAIQPFARKRIR